MNWKDLEDARSELAALGVERFRKFDVAYLATVRADGSPRVHPVTPIVGQGHLFLFMEPTSPKGHDLLRDGRYALHCTVSSSGGESGEFFISGHAKFVDDPTVRRLATELASYAPADRYVLYELSVESAPFITYPDSQRERQHWKSG